MLQTFIQFTVLQFSNLSCGQHFTAIVEESRFTSNGASGSGMIASDHDHTNSRLVAAVYRGLYSGPERVADTYKANGCQSTRIFERGLRWALGYHEYA